MAKYYLLIGFFNCLLIYWLNRERQRPISSIVYIVMLLIWPITIVPALVRILYKK